MATAAPKLLPPIIPGISGNPFLTDQPFQLLSWYPRYLLRTKALFPCQFGNFALYDAQTQPCWPC